MDCFQSKVKTEAVLRSKSTPPTAQREEGEQMQRPSNALLNYIASVERRAELLVFAQRPFPWNA